MVKQTNIRRLQWQDFSTETTILMWLFGSSKKNHTFFGNELFTNLIPCHYCVCCAFSGVSFYIPSPGDMVSFDFISSAARI